MNRLTTRPSRSHFLLELLTQNLLFIWTFFICFEVICIFKDVPLRCAVKAILRLIMSVVFFRTEIYIAIDMPLKNVNGLTGYETKHFCFLLWRQSLWWESMLWPRSECQTRLPFRQCSGKKTKIELKKTFLPLNGEKKKCRHDFNKCFKQFTSSFVLHMTDQSFKAPVIKIYADLSCLSTQLNVNVWVWVSKMDFDVRKISLF